MTERDETENNLIATGAVFMVLSKAGVPARPVLDDGVATNVIEVEFDFLASPYRLTIERVVEGEDATDG